MLEVITDAGTWFAPATRAIWIPAGTVHSWRAQGMTFPQWRTQVRLFHALKMLAAGTSVTMTAHACGWSSTGAFIDVFRNAFGHTPGTHNRTQGVRENFIDDMTRLSRSSGCRGQS